MIIIVRFPVTCSYGAIYRLRLHLVPEAARRSSVAWSLPFRLVELPFGTSITSARLRLQARVGRSLVTASPLRTGTSAERERNFGFPLRRCAVCISCESVGNNGADTCRYTGRNLPDDSHSCDLEEAFQRAPERSPMCILKPSQRRFAARMPCVWIFHLAACILLYVSFLETGTLMSRFEEQRRYWVKSWRNNAWRCTAVSSWFEILVRKNVLREFEWRSNVRKRNDDDREREKASEKRIFEASWSVHISCLTTV